MVIWIVNDKAQRKLNQDFIVLPLASSDDLTDFEFN